MGLTSGKYNIKDRNSAQEILPSLSTKLSGSTKEKQSLPQCIGRNSLADSSSTTKDDSTLVWIDVEINRQPSNIDMQIKLKNLINSLRIFDEVNAFEQYIERIRQINQEKLFIIISPTLALTLIPHLHHHTPIQYIYIYGTAKIDEKIKEEISKRYPKVCCSYFDHSLILFLFRSKGSLENVDVYLLK